MLKTSAEQLRKGVNMAENILVPKRILNTLLASLSAGVVPRTGAPYIAIGRTLEIESICENLKTVEEGGAFTRFIIGRYGSGKSFLIQLIRGYACDNDFVCADADLSPERRLSASSGGAGVATYRELIKNMSTKSSSDGGAVTQILGRWLSDVRSEVASNGLVPGSEEFRIEVSKKIYSTLKEIETGIGAFDFSRVISKYDLAYEEGDDETMSSCLRWLRGEYRTKMEARNQIGVAAIIDDSNWYDYLKLWASFVRKIGYKGFIVFIDECVNLYKISNRISRENNYEKILGIYNDTMQGKVEGMGVIFAGTPQFLEDTRRGLFGYDALRSRLYNTEVQQKNGKISQFNPVIRLVRLTDDELLALIKRVSVLYSQKFGEIKVTPEEMKEFLYIMLSRAGASEMMTPREIMRSYLNALDAVTQGKSMREILNELKPSKHETKTESLDPETIKF